MSLRARVLSWGLARTIKPQMRGTLDVAEMRRSIARMAAPMPSGVEAVAASFGGISGERVINETKAPAPPRLFYLHGGGFVACSPRTHRAITGAFARRGFDVFAADYRLAPEHPFPAAIDDVVAAWRAFSAAGPACVAGDSAGANLALALMLRAREEGVALPRAAAFFSPPVDLVGTPGGSMERHAEIDPMFVVEGLRQVVAFYLNGADAAQPLVSPLNADLAGLPPLLIHVGANEMLLDDATRLAAKAEAAGVAVALRVFPDVPHVWQWADRFLPEATESLDDTADFLRRHV